MNTALILSGGRGLRLGSDIPKQYLEAGGRPVISYCVETLSLHKEIDAIQIVAEQVWREQILAWLEIADRNKKFKGFSLPGENRQLSIFYGLEDIRRYGAADDCVLVHDAARPLLSAELVTECLLAVNGHDGVLPVLPMKDTVQYLQSSLHPALILNSFLTLPDSDPDLLRILFAMIMFWSSF